MKRLTLIAAAACLLGSGLAAAQEPVDSMVWQRRHAQSAASVVQPEVSPSEHPDIWLYLYEQRRWDDPAQAVRRNAELRAAQRRSRIETRKWLGMSASRPDIAPSPFTSFWTPPVYVQETWGTYYWLGYGHPWMSSYRR